MEVTSPQPLPHESPLLGGGCGVCAGPGLGVLTCTGARNISPTRTMGDRMKLPCGVTGLVTRDQLGDGLGPALRSPDTLPGALPHPWPKWAPSSDGLLTVKCLSPDFRLRPQEALEGELPTVGGEKGHGQQEVGKWGAGEQRGEEWGPRSELQADP